MKTIVKKEKKHIFGKDVYLFGIDHEGVKYWLEAPSWDCGWYWGFGYLETYTNNKCPEKSRDISSHQHVDGLFGQHGSDFVNNVFDSPAFAGLTFTEKQGWDLSELFRQFYLLRKLAAFAGKEIPCCVAKSPVIHTGVKGWEQQINMEMIPRITSYILSVLTPEDAKI